MATCPLTFSIDLTNYISENGVYKIRITNNFNFIEATHRKTVSSGGSTTTTTDVVDWDRPSGTGANSTVFTDSLCTQNGTITGLTVTFAFTGSTSYFSMVLLKDDEEIYKFSSASHNTLFNNVFPTGTIIGCQKTVGTSTSVPFYITKDGYLYASNALLSGQSKFGADDCWM